MIFYIPRLFAWGAVFCAVGILETGCAYQIIQSGSLNQPRLAEIQDRTSRARGLAFKRPLEYELLNEKQLRPVLESLLQRDFPKEKWKAWQRMFYRLDAVPENFKLYEGVLSLLMDQASGFYDPITKKLYVCAKPVPAGPIMPLLEFAVQRDFVREFVLSHEMIHALQDQHFDLDRILMTKKDAFDESLAVHALIEGDALLGALIELSADPEDMAKRRELGKRIQQESMGASEALKNAPPVLREYLVFPYYGGLNFVQAYVQRESWRSVNRLYERLPKSSEQILHPEKYYAREMPVKVDMGCYRDALKEWTVLEENTMGEAFMAVLFGRDAAAGWAGDRILLAEGRVASTEEILIWDSRWDTENDAKEFYQAAMAWENKRGCKVVEGESQNRWCTVKGGWEMIGREGNSVCLIQAPSRDFVQRLKSCRFGSKIQ